MDENSIRDDVTKNNCEKMLIKINFAKIILHKIFWEKTFGRDAFYYCKTACFCKIAPIGLIHLFEIDQ